MFFCRVPELLSTMCFLEALTDREAIIVEGVTVLSKAEHSTSLMDGDAEADVLLVDATDFSSDPRRQYEDAYLLRELTKLLAAFTQPHSRSRALERPQPVGGESSSAGSSPSLKSRGSPATGTTGEGSSRSSSRRSSRSEKQKSAIYDDFWRDEEYRRKRAVNQDRTLSLQAKQTHTSTINRPPSPTPKSRSNSAPFTTTKMPHLVSSLQQKHRQQSQDTKQMSSACPPVLPTVARTLKGVVLTQSEVPHPPPLPPSLPGTQKQQLEESVQSWMKKTSSREAIAFLPSGTGPRRRSSGSNSNTLTPKLPNHSGSRKASPKRQLRASPQRTLVPPTGHTRTSVLKIGRIPSQPSGEEEYFTAEEEGSEEEMWYLPGLGITTTAKLQQVPFMTSTPPSKKITPPLPPVPKMPLPLMKPTFKENPLYNPPPPLIQRKTTESSTRSSSIGYCLGDGSDDDLNLSLHERYEDFRNRIRRRSRGLSRRRSSSRHSRLSSSGSSDMEDIDEDPELGFGRTSCKVIRSANSEPSLFQPSSEAEQILISPVLNVPPEAILLAKRGRKLVMTTSDGQLKAYSYDGVHPNLPVPFKARFRRRRSCSEGDDAVRLVSLEEGGAAFYSMANQTFWQKVEEGARSGVTSPASSSQEDLSHPEDGDEDEELPPPGERQHSGKKMSRSSQRVRSSLPPLLPSGDSREGALLEEDEEERYYSLLQPSPDGLRPVATGRWGCGHQRGDPQLKAVLQWLAASVAGLPCLVFYTRGDPHLEKMERLCQLVAAKKWAVGDLACETLRYCRERLSLKHHGPGSQSRTQDGAKGLVPDPPPYLFTILLGDSLLAQQDSLD